MPETFQHLELCRRALRETCYLSAYVSVPNANAQKKTLPLLSLLDSECVSCVLCWRIEWKSGTKSVFNLRELRSQKETGENDRQLLPAAKPKPIFKKKRRFSANGATATHVRNHGMNNWTRSHVTYDNTQSENIPRIEPHTINITKNRRCISVENKIAPRCTL